MTEFVGLIKVNVVKGINLAVRDVMTSDPYVIISLGHQVRFFIYKLLLHTIHSFIYTFDTFNISSLKLQSVKTRVIKNNLNPIWNESLMLSIPDNIPPLKIVSSISFPYPMKSNQTCLL